MQAIISKLQELGLKPLYSKAKYEYLGRVVRGLLSLSLVPLDRVFEGYGIVTQYANQVDEEIKERVAKLVTYHYNTWLTGNFKIDTWNFFGSFLQRTNNVSEGFNHNFNDSEEFTGTTSDPNLWLLIKVMLKHLTRSKQKAQQLEVGQDPRHRRGAVNTHINKEQARHALMLKLTKGKIELPDYMNTVGKSSLLMNTKKEYVPPIRHEKNTDGHTDATTAPTSSGKKQSGAKSGDKKVPCKTPDATTGPTSSRKKPSGAKSGDKKVSSKTPDATTGPTSSGNKQSGAKSSDKKVPSKTPSKSSETHKSGGKKKLYHLTAETPAKTPIKGLFILMLQIIPLKQYICYKSNF